MAQYRKKPVVIEATQWFLKQASAHPGVQYEPGPRRYFVVTIHGQRAYLADGDWIITEPDGKHYYPCKPVIFEMSYTPEDQVISSEDLSAFNDKCHGGAVPPESKVDKIESALKRVEKATPFPGSDAERRLVERAER